MVSSVRSLLISCQDALLDRYDIIALVLFASHEKPKLLHAFGTTSRLRFPLRDLAASSSIAVLLKELFLAALSLALKAFDNINGATKMAVRFVLVLGVLATSHGREECSRAWQ